MGQQNYMGYQQGMQQGMMDQSGQNMMPGNFNQPTYNGSNPAMMNMRNAQQGGAYMQQTGYARRMQHPQQQR